MVTVEGFITVDVSDYSDDIAIVADTEEIIEIMDANNVSIEEVAEACDYQQTKTLVEVADVVEYIHDCDSISELAHLGRMIFHRVERVLQEQAESKVTRSGVVQMEGARV